MRGDRGITLTSLIMYVVLIIIALGILALLRSNFQSSVKELNQQGTNNYEFDKFNVSFLQEVKKDGNGISSVNSSEIIFTTNNKYTFRDNCIYLNDTIKVAENIESLSFSTEVIDKKTVIKVTVKPKKSEEKVVEYVLNDYSNFSNIEDESSYTK